MKILFLTFALILIFPQAVNATLAAEELDILHRIVWAEARGEDTKGQILVVNVIFNRLNCSNFPDRIQATPCELILL